VLERADSTHAAALPGAKGGWLYTLPGVVAAVGLYSFAHVTARLIASANLGEDDPLEAVRTQTLQLGYGPQPPLYDWVLWLIEQVTGPGALPFQLVKYALLTATCAFIFASARRVMKGEAFWAFLSVEALALIYQISWRFHEGFTHAVGAMCAVAAALWAMLRLIEHQRARDYTLFGMIGGLGLLTVLPFAVYLAALTGAAALQPASRRAVMRPGFLLSIAIVLAIPTPWLVWLAGTPDGISAILPHMMIGSPGYGQAALKGIQRAFTEPVLYLAPLIFLYPIFFPAWLGTVRRTAMLKPQDGPRADFEQLVLHLTLLNVGALLLGAAVFGIKSYPVHALMPLFLVTSIWLTAQARKAARNEGEVRRFVIMALGIAVFAFFARSANMYVQEPVCKICRWGIPYDGLANAMKARGFAHGQLVVYDEDLAGNLRRFFPDARVVVAGPRRYVPPETPVAPGDKTVFVWEVSAKRAGTAERDFAEMLPGLAPAVAANAETVRIPWRGHIWKPDGYRQSEWRLAILERR
jgi:hypothetical protein